MLNVIPINSTILNFTKSLWYSIVHDICIYIKEQIRLIHF